MAQEVKYPDVEVQLVGLNGNAYAIIGRCVQAARAHNVPKEEIEKFKQEATSGNYDHLLQTCMKWFDVH